MQTADALLLLSLQALEVELHKPAARSDASRLNALLHDDFREFGRSGTAYTKADMLSHLLAQAQHADVVADRFEMSRLSDGVALLTYRSAHRVAAVIGRFTLRSSVWVHSPQGWQMRFHQGTPTTQSEPQEQTAPTS